MTSSDSLNPHEDDSVRVSRTEKGGVRFSMASEDTPRLDDRGVAAGQFMLDLATNLSVHRNKMPFEVYASTIQRLESLAYHFGKYAADEEASVTMDVSGYEELARVLKMAYDQSANGKGRERHGQGLPFHEQAINSIPKLLRSGAIGATTYQTIKKTQEAIGMFERGDTAAAKAEILGSIIYAVATILTIEASEKKTEN